MHAIIIFLYYLSKLLNLTLNLESLSSSFLNKLILLANFSAAGKLFQWSRRPPKDRQTWV